MYTSPVGEGFLVENVKMPVWHPVQVKWCAPVNLLWLTTVADVRLP